jgi:hypothetical protein
MMSWNYRLVRDKKGILTIREVYYDDKGEPEGISQPLIIQAYEDEDEDEKTVLNILEKIRQSIEKYGIMDDPWPDE